MGGQVVSLLGVAMAETPCEITTESQPRACPRCCKFCSLMLSCGVGIVAVAYGLASDDGACVGVIQEPRDDCRLPRFDAKSPNATRCFHRLRGRSPLLIEGLIDEWPHLAWSFQDWQEELRNMTLPVRSARLTSLGGGQIEAEGVSGAEFFDRILDRDDILVFNTAHKESSCRTRSLPKATQVDRACGRPQVRSSLLQLA